MLEKVQKRVMRIIYGDYESDYQSLCQRAKLDTLEERRKTQCDKYIKKCLKNDTHFIHDILPDTQKSEHNLRTQHLLEVVSVLVVTVDS